MSEKKKPGSTSRSASRPSSTALVQAAATVVEGALAEVRGVATRRAPRAKPAAAAAPAAPPSPVYSGPEATAPSHAPVSHAPVSHAAVSHAATSHAPSSSHAAPPHPAAGHAAPTHALIAQRAYALFRERGGSAFDNWIAAERELSAR